MEPKVIQQVHVSDDLDIYLTDWNGTTMELTYRASANPGSVTEVIGIVDDKVVMPEFWFAKTYLDKFIEANPTEDNPITI